MTSDTHICLHSLADVANMAETSLPSMSAIVNNAPALPTSANATCKPPAGDLSILKSVIQFNSRSLLVFTCYA